MGSLRSLFRIVQRRAGLNQIQIEFITVGSQRLQVDVAGDTFARLRPCRPAMFDRYPPY
jgi:hypothetical protein